MFNDHYRRIVTVVLVVAVLLGFATIALSAIYRTHKEPETPQFNEPLLYIANVLTSLVGGIVALGFGQSPPASNFLSTKEKFDRRTLALGQMLLPSLNGPQLPGTTLPVVGNAPKILGGVYALVYIVLGMAAVVTWGIDNKPPDLIKNLATVALGLFVPIVVGFFQPPAAKPAKKFSHISKIESEKI